MERHHHPNGSSSSPSLPMSSFRAAAQRAHNAVVEEFGGSYLSRYLSTGVSEAVENLDDPCLTTDAGVELQEFPWAKGYVCDVETAGAIASRAQWFALSDNNWSILKFGYPEPSRGDKSTRHSPQLPTLISTFIRYTIQTSGQQSNLYRNIHFLLLLLWRSDWARSGCFSPCALAACLSGHMWQSKFGSARSSRVFSRIATQCRVNSTWFQCQSTGEQVLVRHHNHHISPQTLRHYAEYGRLCILYPHSSPAAEFILNALPSPAV